MNGSYRLLLGGHVFKNLSCGWPGCRFLDTIQRATNEQLFAVLFVQKPIASKHRINRPSIAQRLRNSLQSNCDICAISAGERATTNRNRSWPHSGTESDAVGETAEIYFYVASKAIRRHEFKLASLYEFVFGAGESLCAIAESGNEEEICEDTNTVEVGSMQEEEKLSFLREHSSDFSARKRISVLRGVHRCLRHFYDEFSFGYSFRNSSDRVALSISVAPVS